ncbi:hypothetical protein C8J56DRAFT_441053 [Mycena floridula]|nr:hypothetical protein C8J56DRAFT_441053 [Mycena floridula]
MYSTKHYLYSIPASLFFIVPLFSIVLIIFSASVSRPASRILHLDVPSRYRIFSRTNSLKISYFSISFLALLALLVAAVGLDKLTDESFALAATESILLASLHFHLSLSGLFLTVASVSPQTMPPAKLCTYSAVLGALMICATVLAILPPFLPPKDSIFSFAIPPLLPPLLSLLFATLSLALLAYITLLSSQPRIVHRTPPSLPSQVSWNPPSPSSHRKATSLDISSSVSRIELFDVEVQRAHTPALTSNSTRLGGLAYVQIHRNFWLLLLSAQGCSLLSFAFNICGLVLVDPFPPSIQKRDISYEIFVAAWKADLSLRMLESIFSVGWAACMMCSFMLYTLILDSEPPSTTPNSPNTSITLSCPDTPNSPATPLTEFPSRPRHVRTRPHTLSSLSSLVRVSLPPRPRVENPESRLSISSAGSPSRRRPLKPALRVRTNNIHLNLNCTSANSASPDKKLRSLYNDDGFDDPLGTLNSDPFAPPEPGIAMRNSAFESHPESQPQTRMSAWGSLTLPLPPPLPLAVRPSRSDAPRRNAIAWDATTSDMTALDAEYEHIHREEALLSQRLLRRLENGVGWVTGKGHGSSASFAWRSGNKDQRALK